MNLSYNLVMIKLKTILVLGAGASMPYGFPSGQGLIDKICDSGNDFIDTLGIAGFTPNVVTEFRAELKGADTDSIDVFLERRPEFQEVGKAAIVVTLLPCERELELIDKWRSERLREEKSKLGGHWYKHLSSTLHTSFEDFDKNQLSIITFNYDRSLEHYLYTTLQKSYGKTEQECTEKLRAIEIIHVYGQIGLLPWQAPNDSDKNESITFGSWSPVPSEAWAKKGIIHYATKGVKTISEGFEKKDPEIIRAKRLLADAQRIYFLGFGFYHRNREILGMKLLHHDTYIRGTSLGLSMERKQELHKLGITSLKWETGAEKLKGLHDMDVYDFLYNRVILN